MAREIALLLSVDNLRVDNLRDQAASEAGPKAGEGLQVSTFI
jgi:hypothetical protein